MGRAKDDYHLNQASKEDRELNCKHCNKRFKGGEELCPHSTQFPPAMLAGSSNQLESPNESDSLQVSGDHQNTLSAPASDVAGPSNMVEGGGDEDMFTACFETMNPQHDAAGPSNMVVEEGLPLSNGNNSFESRIKEIRELLDELSNQEERHKDYLQWLEYCGEKHKREEAHDWLKKMEGVKEEANQVVELLRQDALQDPLKKTDALISKLKCVEYGIYFRWVDQDFREVRDLLRDDNVFFIGVCGMGGVGKTWLATHFRNQIRWNKSFNFENVFWVTVSQDFSILKLQNSIAKRIGVKLDDDDEITDRAEILSSALEKIGRLVLILDGVWNYIDLQKVGIPLRTNGIKLILTSRLQHVFQQMDCPTHNLIQMKPLYGDIEGWELFLQKLGCDGRAATLSGEVENTARSVVKMCENLPLGINVMARLMKGVKNDINVWKYTLSKLENSAMPKDMEEEVMKVLKRSYDHLADITIQNCFLQHALYSEVSLSGEMFSMNLVDEGIIQSTRSLEKILVEGQAILAKLCSHSLIYLSSEGYRNFWCMHGLLRDMASDIVKGKFMVRCKKELKNIPEMQEWAPHLEKVSLMGNSIQEIPEGTSPQCPYLSTLNLSTNMITHIPDCFFYYLKALSLLDLSYNRELTSLPNSLSTLMCLKSLLLEGCFSLKYVPPLGNLQKLLRLVISGTSIKQVPDGLGKLAKLRWLDLSHNTQLECVAWSVIFGLTNLQYLNLLRTCITGEVEIAQGMLSNLEYFLGSFRDTKNFAGFVENILNRDGGVKYYDIRFPTPFVLHEPHVLGMETKRVIAGNFKGFELLLPHDLEELYIKYREWSGDLCGSFSFKAPSSLRKIDARDCPKVERLCCLCIHCSFCQHLQNLQSLVISDLERLDAIWGEDDEFIGLPNLSHLQIMYCRRIQSLMSAESLAKFPKLESIDVYKCGAMKEIFATGMSGDDPDVTITLPKSFRELKIEGLPELVGVTMCSSIIVSESPPEVKVRYCGNLTQSHIRYKPSPSAPESTIDFTKL